MFSLAYSAQVIIWVIVGGLGTLVGPVIGCILLQFLTTWAGTLPQLNANLVLGCILVLAVSPPPQGPSPHHDRPPGPRPPMTPLLETHDSPCASAASSP